MLDYSKLSDEVIRSRIKSLEAMGFTGETNAELHALNVEQTDRLSDTELLRLMHDRKSSGQPFGKLAAAANRRHLRF